MFAPLRLLLLLVPFVELYLLFVIAQYTTAATAFTYVLVSGLAGAMVIRFQGLRTWRQAQAELAAGRMPGPVIVDGALILLAGVLLIIPGPLTDLLAVALLIPAVRRWMRLYWRRRSEARFLGGAAGWTTQQYHRDEIIESRVIDAQPPRDGTSPGPAHDDR